MYVYVEFYSFLNYMKTTCITAQLYVPQHMKEGKTEDSFSILSYPLG